MSYGDALAALADPTRRAVFEALTGGPLAVVELASRIPVSRPAVSQHLKVLKEAGLVNDEPHGARRLYRVDPGGLIELHAYLDGFWDDALSRYQAEAQRRARKGKR